MEQKPKRMSFSINQKPHFSRNSNRSVCGSQINTIKSTLYCTPFKTRKSSASHNLMIARQHSSKYSSISSTCWCLYDSKTQTELGFRQGYKRQVASLTKIMTTVVGLQLKKRFELSEHLMIKITQTSTKIIGTTANLKHLNWIALKDLFYAVMLPSGNDAAHLLAQTLGFLIFSSGGQYDGTNFQSLKEVDLSQRNTTLYLAEFIKAMNLKAEQLKLSQTRFSNPHGLHNALNTSTAKDMMALSIYATQNDSFRKIMNCQVHRCYNYNHLKTRKQAKQWWNTNALLKDGWQGVKTGQTVAAGNCLSSLKNGIYIVVLNCPDSVKRFSETKRLYEWYSQKRKTINSTMVSSTDSFQS